MKYRKIIYVLHIQVYELWCKFNHIKKEKNLFFILLIYCLINIFLLLTS